MEIALSDLALIFDRAMQAKGEMRLTRLRALWDKMMAFEREMLRSPMSVPLQDIKGFKRMIEEVKPVLERSEDAQRRRLAAKP